MQPWETVAFYLTPPPSSADVECLFSTAGHIYSDDRNRLKPENLEKLLFLRENLKYLDFKYQMIYISINDFYKSLLFFK